MVKVREGTVDDEKLDLSLVSMLQKGGPDSGLGSSASASSGPSHIEDWPSLAILLPKLVVFFISVETDFSSGKVNMAYGIFVSLLSREVFTSYSAASSAR